MLDVSRDRVPTMERLLETIDRLAEFKINQIQLYMEHAFAYERHEIVWRDASPFTAQEIRTIDAFCRARFIELVPNQNSFGHMERWLRHDPYNALAELPERAREQFAGSRSLCPIDERVFPFLDGLYGELLPNFSSRQFNAGLDETFDLGQGRSREACATRGSGRVYLDYLKKVYELVRKHGHRMLFWADIILHYPELIGELPRDWLTALVWGYEADHPFDEQCRRLRQSGIPFYVCPGTSSWNSLTGRTANMRANMTAAARAAAGGAAGLLVRLGRNGHWQHPPLAWPASRWGRPGLVAAGEREPGPGGRARRAPVRAARRRHRRRAAGSWRGLPGIGRPDAQRHDLRATAAVSRPAARGRALGGPVGRAAAGGDGTHPARPGRPAPGGPATAGGRAGHPADPA